MKIANKCKEWFKKSSTKKNQIIFICMLIFFFVCAFLIFFSIYLSASIIKISKLKVNEITTNIVNDAIFNYKKTKLP